MLDIVHAEPFRTLYNSISCVLSAFYIYRTLMLHAHSTRHRWWSATMYCATVIRLRYAKHAFYRTSSMCQWVDAGTDAGVCVSVPARVKKISPFETILLLMLNLIYWKISDSSFVWKLEQDEIPCIPIDALLLVAVFCRTLSSSSSLLHFIHTLDILCVFFSSLSFQSFAQLRLLQLV